jgi:hypothetical protein
MLYNSKIISSEAAKVVCNLLQVTVAPPNHLSLLEGISGIGLVLLAIEQNEIPGWENGLLI